MCIRDSVEAFQAGRGGLLPRQIIAEARANRPEHPRREGGRGVDAGRTVEEHGRVAGKLRRAGQFPRKARSAAPRHAVLVVGDEPRLPKRRPGLPIPPPVLAPDRPPAQPRRLGKAALDARLAVALILQSTPAISPLGNLVVDLIAAEDALLIVAVAVVGDVERGVDAVPPVQPVPLEL